MTPTFLSLILTIPLIPMSSARGPHHPRGGNIVKRNVHHAPQKTQKITQDVELLHDKEHIKEHLEELVPEVDLSKMTEAELELYYFLLHDSDKNSKLDGLELLNAVLHTTHQHKEDNEEEEEEEEDEGVSEEEFDSFVDLVDQVLKEDDKNQDGYLDYAEYVEGREGLTRIKNKS